MEARSLRPYWKFQILSAMKQSESLRMQKVNETIRSQIVFLSKVGSVSIFLSRLQGAGHPGNSKTGFTEPVLCFSVSSKVRSGRSKVPTPSEHRLVLWHHHQRECGYLLFLPTTLKVEGTLLVYIKMHLITALDAFSKVSFISLSLPYNEINTYDSNQQNDC